MGQGADEVLRTVRVLEVHELSFGPAPTLPKCCAQRRLADSLRVLLEQSMQEASR